MFNLLSRGVPAYLLLALFYVGFVVVVAGPSIISGEPTAVETVVEDTDATTETAAETEAEGDALEEPAADPDWAQRGKDAIEAAMQRSISIPFLSGVSFDISWTTLFIIGGFMCAWVEAIRATNSQVSGNDFMSLIVTIASLILFIGVPWFSTTAFMIVPLVGIGDLFLDRYIGQAVARRDFGGMYPHDIGGE